MSDIEKMRDIAKRAIEKKYAYDGSVCEIMHDKIEVKEFTDNITGEVYYATRYCAIIKTNWSPFVFIVQADHTGGKIGTSFVFIDDEVFAKQDDIIVEIIEITKFEFDTIVEAKNGQNNNG